MENQNSVAYVGKIADIQPIAGADFIELAEVGGWHGIIKKNTFFKGDLVVIFTNDAVIPEELSAKLNITSYLRGGTRVRTVKLKDVHSECLIVNPFEIYGSGVFPIKEGKDLQDSLKVYKYEPPVATFQHTDGNVESVKQNGNFAKYEKFPNAKNVRNLFQEGDIVVSTRKIHGSNFRSGIVRKSKLSIIDRVMVLFGKKWAAYEYVIGSHNTQRSDISKSVYKEAADKYSLKQRLWQYCKIRLNPKDIGSGLIVYGEVFGENIQGEHYTYGVKGRDLKAFDISVNGKYLGYFQFKHVIDILQVPSVEELWAGLYDEDRVLSTVGGYIPGTKVPEEGAVVKTTTGERRKVAKFINNEYLTFAEKKSVPDSH